MTVNHIFVLTLSRNWLKTSDLQIITNQYLHVFTPTFLHNVNLILIELSLLNSIKKYYKILVYYMYLRTCKIVYMIISF